MIRTVRSVRLLCVVALGGLLLAGCVGTDSNRATVVSGLTVSESMAEVDGADTANPAFAEGTETVEQPAVEETAPQLAPGTGMLATGATGRAFRRHSGVP